MTLWMIKTIIVYHNYSNFIAIKRQKKKQNKTTKHTNIHTVISVLGFAPLDVQIQQWGNGGPQLMLLKWV